MKINGKSKFELDELVKFKTMPNFAEPLTVVAIAVVREQPKYEGIMYWLRNSEKQIGNVQEQLLEKHISSDDRMKLKNKENKKKSKRKYKSLDKLV